MAKQKGEDRQALEELLEERDNLRNSIDELTNKVEELE